MISSSGELHRSKNQNHSLACAKVENVPVLVRREGVVWRKRCRGQMERFLLSPVRTHKHVHSSPVHARVFVRFFLFSVSFTRVWLLLSFALSLPPTMPSIAFSHVHSYLPPSSHALPFSLPLVPYTSSSLHLSSVLSTSPLPFPLFSLPSILPFLFFPSVPLASLSILPFYSFPSALLSPSLLSTFCSTRFPFYSFPSIRSFLFQSLPFNPPFRTDPSPFKPSVRTLLHHTVRHGGNQAHEVRQTMAMAMARRRTSGLTRSRATTGERGWKKDTRKGACCAWKCDSSWCVRRSGPLVQRKRQGSEDVRG